MPALAPRVDQRRRVGGDHVRRPNRLTSALNNDVPHVLPWAQEHATALLCDGRRHGPRRTSAPLARRTTLERCFRTHHYACPLERAWPLAHPTSRLGEIVPLGDSQMERLRKNILLGVIEAIALRGTI
jgi:hypothetical protein